MRISASLGNNINFIEQKTNVSKENKNQSDTTTTSHSDSFTSASVASKEIISHNDSLGMLQVAHDSITLLKEKNKNLHSLSEKLEYFKNDQSSLEKEFESVIEEMFDVVDRTVYNNTQLFYTNMSFSQTQAMPSVMLNDIISIEDLSIEDKDGLLLLDKKLGNLHEDLSKAKDFIQIVSFNTLAASSYSETNIEGFSLEGSKESTKQVINKGDIQRAHDMNSLKDKVSFLLAD